MPASTGPTSPRLDDLSLQQLAEFFPGPSWIAAREGTCVFVNDEWRRHTGCMVSEMRELEILDWVHYEDRERVTEELVQARGREHEARFECRLRSADSEPHWFDMRLLPLRDARGHVKAWFGSCTDIQAARTAVALRAASEAQEAQLRALVSNMSEGLIVADAQGHLIDWNPAALKIHGFAATDDMRRHVSTFTRNFIVRTLEGTIVPFENWPIPRLLRGEEVRDLEVQLERLDRPQSFIMIYNGSLLRNADGSPSMVLLTIHEVTERRRKDAQIARLNAELEARVLERTLELRAANAELESFAYAVSHELRAPLRAMNGFGNALLEDCAPGLDETARGYIANILAASLSMGALVDGLLQLSRNTRGNLERQECDLSALAESVLADLARAEPLRAVKCSIEPGLRVLGDPRLIEGVLRNLLGNAWKYTARTAEPVIHFHTSQLEGQACFVVEDNGSGFALEHADKLFRPFQRLHRQDEFPGIGIGLATVQRIIHRHGGWIQARAYVGKGAQFYFTLSPTKSGDGGRS